MVEEGIVQSVEEDVLVVEIQRPSACSGCAARGACLTLGPSRRVIRVRRPADAQAVRGDRVRLEIRSVTFLRATFMGYMVPTLAFFAGVAVVMLAVDPGGTVLGVQRDVAAFVAGGAGVAGSFAALWLTGSRGAARERYAPRVVEVLGQRDPSGC